MADEQRPTQPDSFAAGRRRAIVALSGTLAAPAGTPIRTLAPEDADYPAGLHALADRPRRLHVRGAALPLAEHAVAIVGARAATPYGRGVAERLARDLARGGVTIVSGLARGIDTAAHLGALSAPGRTVAVIPSALDQVTPASHAALAERIAQSGAVVSEVAIGGPFGRGAFVKRNRLIAGMAAVTVVVEASAESGALATASVARSLGRIVLAVPGDVDRPGAAGTLALLRSGAKPCADAGDVWAVLGPITNADDPDARLRSQLGASPRGVEELSLACGTEPGETLARLLRMEWSGLATAHPGGRWSERR